MLLCLVTFDLHKKSQLCRNGYCANTMLPVIRCVYASQRANYYHVRENARHAVNLSIDQWLKLGRVTEGDFF